MCSRAVVVLTGSVDRTFIRSRKKCIMPKLQRAHKKCKHAGKQSAICLHWVSSYLKRWSRTNSRTFFIWLHFSILKFCSQLLSPFNVHLILCWCLVLNNWLKWCQSLVIRLNMFFLFKYEKSHPVRCLIQSIAKFMHHILLMQWISILFNFLIKYVNWICEKNTTKWSLM